MPIYMHIPGLAVEERGIATTKIEGGPWFQLQSCSWGANRSIPMVVGNLSNADSGHIHFLPISIQKYTDGASAGLLSALLMAGVAFDEVVIVFTKQVTGNEHAIYLQIRLNGARITNYHIQAGADGVAGESLNLVYHEITQKVNPTDKDGLLVEGAPVTYDLAGGVLTSGATGGGETSV